MIDPEHQLDSHLTMFCSSLKEAHLPLGRVRQIRELKILFRIVLSLTTPQEVWESTKQGAMVERYGLHNFH
jgi:hypothetical protein